MATTKKKTTYKPYMATLLIMGREHSAKGETVLDAIRALKPGNARGKAVLVVTDGYTARERILQPGLVMKSFNTRGIFQEIALKQLASLFSL
jgi:hypothetical protein